MKESAELNIKMADFLEKLETQGLHLGKHSFEIKTNYNIAIKENATYTDQILDALYDFGKLDEDQRFLLLNLSFLPAEPYTLEFINSLLATETSRTDLKLRNTLKSLVKKGWIGQTEGNYRLSPVVQDLMLHKNKKNLGVDSKDLLDRLDYILDADAYNLLNSSLTDADPYAKLIIQLSKSLDDHPSRSIGALNFNSGIYYRNIGNVTDFKNCFENYQKICQKLLINEPENLDYKYGLAISFNYIGNFFLETGIGKMP